MEIQFLKTEDKDGPRNDRAEAIALMLFISDEDCVFRFPDPRINLVQAHMTDAHAVVFCGRWPRYLVVPAAMSLQPLFEVFACIRC